MWDQPKEAPSVDGLPIIDKNSRRVEASSRKAPSMRLVTKVDPGLWMPRVVMQ